MTVEKIGNYCMKSAIVTGAAGFTGGVLTEQLRKAHIEVYAIVRPGSLHNNRLAHDDNGIHIIELDATDLKEIPNRIENRCDVFFHLLWVGGKSFTEQRLNVDISLEAVAAAKKCGCRRIVLTGSQAEYGEVPINVIETENYTTKPITAYGAAKVAACHLTNIQANELGVEWIWGRIFSLIGKYEPRGRMLPDLFDALKAGREMVLSSCEQNWDYLDVHDAASALIALGEKGCPGEIYNIAHGDFRPLREYTEQLRLMVAPEVRIKYGAAPNPFITLQPSVNKLKDDTGWTPRFSFEDSIKDYS